MEPRTAPAEAQTNALSVPGTAGGVSMSPCGNYYLRDGIKYLRVSRVLDFIPTPGLGEWRGRLGNREANKVLRASEAIGKEVDTLIGGYLTDFIWPMPPNVKKPEVACCLAGFREWHHLNRTLTIYGQQVTLFEPDLQIAGTADLITDHELIDWKTTNQISLKHVYQVLLYWWMAMTTLALPITQARIVRFDKQLGTFEEKVIPWQAEMFSRVCDLAKFAVHWYGMVDLQQGGEES